MKPGKIPRNERERLAALKAYEVLDTGAEAAFDNLTFLAAYICKTPISLVSLVDEKRQWFKSRQGVQASETPREVAFCAHAIHEEKIFVVENAREDERFFDNPLVAGETQVVFYAGVPLTSPKGYNVGTLCVIDHIPRKLDNEQKKLWR